MTSLATLRAPLLAARASPAGLRFASSSAARVVRPGLKAFPVFRNSRGVIECNELFLHHITGEQARPAARHVEAPEVSAQAQQAARMAELYADLVMTREDESPILMECMGKSLGSVGSLGGARATVSDVKQPVRSLA